MNSNFVEKIRKQRNISQTALAKAAGIDRRTLWLFETGKSSPSIQTVSKIADILGVSNEYLLTGQDTGNKKRQAKEFNSKKLISAIKLTKASFGANFSEDFLIEIATEVMLLIEDYDIIKNDQEKVTKFHSKLNEMYTTGLAAKCFLNALENKINYESD